MYTCTGGQGFEPKLITLEGADNLKGRGRRVETKSKYCCKINKIVMETNESPPESCPKIHLQCPKIPSLF